MGIDVDKTGNLIYEKVVDDFGSVKKASEYLGISTNAIYNWKTRSKIPDLENLIMISDHMGCSVNDLVVMRL